MSRFKFWFLHACSLQISALCSIFRHTAVLFPLAVFFRPWFRGPRRVMRRRLRRLRVLLPSLSLALSWPLPAAAVPLKFSYFCDEEHPCKTKAPMPSEATAYTSVSSTHKLSVSRERLAVQLCVCVSVRMSSSLVLVLTVVKGCGCCSCSWR